MVYCVELLPEPHLRQLIYFSTQTVYHRTLHYTTPAFSLPSRQCLHTCAVLPCVGPSQICTVEAREATWRWRVHEQPREKWWLTCTAEPLLHAGRKGICTLVPMAHRLVFARWGGVWQKKASCTPCIRSGQPVTGWHPHPCWSLPTFFRTTVRILLPKKT